MADSDDELRAAYARLAASAGGPHPDDALWERLAEGALDSDQRLRLADHVTRCAECRDVYRGVQALRDAAPRARVLPFRRRAAWGAGLAVAAVLVLALFMPQPGPAPAPAGDALRSDAAGRPVPRSPRGRLVSAPTSLAWEPLSGARAYRVQVLGGDGASLWTSAETQAHELPWPAHLTLDPGRYYWQVVARVGLDEERASPLIDFEIAPR